MSEYRDHDHLISFADSSIGLVITDARDHPTPELPINVTTLSDTDGWILEALRGVALADDDVDPGELNTVLQVYEELTGRRLAIDHLQACARARQLELSVGDLTAVVDQSLQSGVSYHHRRRLRRRIGGITTRHAGPALRALSAGLYKRHWPPTIHPTFHDIGHSRWR